MENGKEHAVHIMGLLSDGGVHSHIDHLKALIKMAKEQGVEKVYVHAFTDGRDTDPQSGINYVKEIEAYMAEMGVGQFATINGRYYAMDRDKRWEKSRKKHTELWFVAKVKLLLLHLKLLKNLIKRCNRRIYHSNCNS